MFYESDLKYIAKEIARIQKKYDICAKFVLGEKGEGYICLGISKNYKGKYYVPNPKLIPEVLCEQAYYPDHMYPYQTLYVIKEDNYLKDILKVIELAKKLEAIKHVYDWYDHANVPERISMVDVEDILDVYEKYINDWFPEEKIRFQALLVTLIKKTTEEKYLNSKWRNFRNSAQYDDTKGKFQNCLRYLFQNNLSHVSSRYIHARFDDMKHIYVTDSEYQKIEKWITDHPQKIIYSSEKVFHDYKKDLFKKNEKNPWEMNATNQDVWKISVPEVMLNVFYKIYMKICYGNVRCNDVLNMFHTAPIYAFHLPKEQLSYWEKCANATHIMYGIDFQNHFSEISFDSIPIIVYEEDYQKINQILNKIIDVYLETHIEIPQKERFHIDGLVFRSGQQLSEEESQVLQNHFTKIQ